MRRATFDPSDVLTRSDAEALAHRVFGLTGGRPTSVTISSGIGADASFARGDAHLVREGAAVQVYIGVGGASVFTTRVDDASLERAIAQADAMSEDMASRAGPLRLRPPRTYETGPKTFFDSVMTALRNDDRRRIFDKVMDATRAAGLIAAGEVQLSGNTRLMMNTGGYTAFQQGTYGEFSLTARTKDGMGSGWAWSGFGDWSRVDADAVIKRAVSLAERSAKPVAVEPGRYTVILEPAAVASLVRSIDWGGSSAESGTSVFSKHPVGTTKVGLQMVDQRMSMVSDPWDPDMPDELLNSDGNTVAKTVRFENGFLKGLVYSYTRQEEMGLTPSFPPDGLRITMVGPSLSLDEMIASTKRGIWVNRLSGDGIMNTRTHLLTGTTRDGTFLIENGKVTKAIRNLRFTESPFFIFNKIDAWGDPEVALRSIAAPRLKVRDFDFTSLTDAI